MVSLKDKIVFITGASAGIGRASAELFASEGAKLIITARREQLINELAEGLNNKYGINVLPLKMDVRDREDVKSVIGTLPEEWKSVDILINNAGLAKGVEKVFEGDFDNWDTMIDTNIKGLLYVTRLVLPGMIERDSGHVINLGSTAGHMSYAGASVYCATKYSVRAISDAVRIETADSSVRVSSVDPGAVETDFSNVRFDGDKERAKKVYKGFKPLTAVDVAEAILFCATRPEHANINEIILSSTSQANSLIINRK